MNKKDTEIIICGYEQANKDAKDLLRYLSTLDDPSKLELSKLPSIVRNLENPNSNVSKTYIATASLLGGTAATAVSASLSTGMFSRTIGFANAAKIGVAGVAAPFLAWFVVPVTAFSLAKALFHDIKLKKYMNLNKDAFIKNSKELDKEKNKLLGWLNDLQMRTSVLDEETRKNINEKFSDFKKKTKKAAKDISIQIDDCLNTDTNKRILQYNEVILKQYKLEKELEDKVNYLFTQYNDLLIEKQELAQQIDCLIKLLNAMECPKSILDDVLSGKGA